MEWKMKRLMGITAVVLAVAFFTLIHFPPSLQSGKNRNFHGDEGIVTDDGILPPSTNLQIDDVTITIKTSNSLMERWDKILHTWGQQVNTSVFWITDNDDNKLLKQQSQDGHVIETDCLTDHSLLALSCKTEAEFEEYMKRKTKWWCHIDDDMYVNINVLFRLLSKYDSDTDVYIGRNSVNFPLVFMWGEILVNAWFGTGGGYCISRALALKMDKYVSNGQLRSFSQKLFAADDGAMGFIINFLLHTKLTSTNLINTHLHGLNLLKPHEIPLQAMLSYRKGGNCVNLTAEDVRGKSKFFTLAEDPSRFFTIHCMIHPQTDYCQHGGRHGIS